MFQPKLWKPSAFPNWNIGIASIGISALANFVAISRKQSPNKTEIAV